ncbi:helix-turn-helix domain-containing protein [Thermoactinospora rubra]|uniref:AraC-like ligand-binding domain-containing protein n=1 Tax=Thermoactinospora rubra TaxID=1088767 RepID=UPI00117FD9ED|nr:helix-turn-helix domain-containing protein [Thermoactinospora rubra]
MDHPSQGRTPRPREGAPAAGRTREAVAPFELRPRDENGHAGRIRTVDFGVVTFVDIAAPGSEAVRDRALIRRSGPRVCSIHVQIRGHPVVEQGDRQIQVRPGDLAFVDLSRPTRVAGAAHHQVSLVFPCALLPFAGGGADLSGVVVSGRDGAGALLYAMVRQVAEDPTRFGAAAAGVGSALLDLTLAAFAPASTPPAAAPPQPRRHSLLLRIRAYVEENLKDPALSPRTIANAHHVSLRYLHRLFEDQPTTLAGLIRTRRLERCRLDLADPVLAEVPVHAIGSRWGFTDPARFSTAFRQAYGLPPGAYRLKCAEEQAGEQAEEQAEEQAGKQQAGIERRQGPRRA